jgi:hypothetical protein
MYLRARNLNRALIGHAHAAASAACDRELLAVAVAGVSGVGSDDGGVAAGVDVNGGGCSETNRCDGAEGDEGVGEVHREGLGNVYECEVIVVLVWEWMEVDAVDATIPTVEGHPLILYHYGKLGKHRASDLMCIA